jgi:3-deoxy-D-manno-octulosonic-acid transferase
MALPPAMAENAGIMPPATALTGAERVYQRVAPLAFSLVHLAARAAAVDAGALRQRRGMLPPVAGPCLWLHGASAGEMAAATKLVGLLRGHGFTFTAAYTATNDAGLALVRRRLAPGDVCALAPWDVPRWVARGLDCWQPRALVLIETEIWPALIHAAAARRVPVLSASARIYPRDLPRYRLVRPVIASSLRRLTAVLAQSEAERQRLQMLGAPPERCAVAGNLKHVLPPDRADASAFRKAVGLRAGQRVWTAGSVHADEVAFLCAAVERLPARVQVVVAPRRASALRALDAEVQRRGWVAARRSDAARPDWRLLVLDTMGELRAAYAAAAVAFVGGTIGRHGGHDLIEPLQCGAPVLFGPHTAHVEPEAGALRTALPSALVRSPEELAARVGAWLNDDRARAAALALQRAALPDPEAIGRAYIEALAPFM